MAILVNYYPCSYGDSLVSMLNGASPARLNGQIDTDAPVFKQQDYYLGSQDKKINLLKNLDNRAYSCHRQKSFDYAVAGQITVISINVDWIDFLPGRVKKIHLEKNKNKIDNPVLQKLSHKLSLEQLILFDYKSWAKTNILETDIVLDFTTLIDTTKCENFCSTHNLNYNKDWVVDIQKDLQKYVQ